MAFVLHGLMSEHLREIQVGHIGDVADTLAGDQRPGRRIVIARIAAAHLRVEGISQPSGGDRPEAFAVVEFEIAVSDIAQRHRLFEDRVEHRLKLAGRAVDDLQYLGDRLLLFEALAQFGRAAACSRSR